MSSLKTKYRRMISDAYDARDVSYPTLFWLFIAGSLLGFLMEGCWHYLRNGSWADRVATLWGPFCIIYGAGAVVMYLLALRLQGRRIGVQFAAFALTGSTVEYLASVFQEAAFGTMSWNYSKHTLNIGGRISLQMALLWGVAGMALMYLILPLLILLLTGLHLDRHSLVCWVMTIFMAVNLALTGCALLRWEARQEGTPARNAFEEMIDQRWGDEWMRERFPNMKFVSN